jgi:hypothetical protein
MADFTPLLTRAIAALPVNTLEARNDIYERARAALIRQLRGIDPPLDEAMINKEAMALESTIEAIEVEQRGALLEASLVSEMERELSIPPVVETGARAVHNAVREAEQLGGAVEDAKKMAEGALEAMAPEEEPTPAAPMPDRPRMDPALEAFRAPREPDDLRPPATDLDRLPLRPRSAVRDEPATGGVTAKIIVALCVLALLIGGGWLGYAFFAGSPKPASVATSTPSPARESAEPAKAEDRLRPPEPPSLPTGVSSGQSKPASPPAAPETKEAAPAAAPVPPGAVTATLLEEIPGSQSGQSLPGSVAWRTEPSNSGTPGETVLRADIEIPERRLGITLLFRPNTDQTLPASHTVEILFRLPRDFAFGGVSNVPALLMKPTAQARGAPLIGQAVRVTSGFFLIGLSSEPGDKTTNLVRLKDNAFIDLPVLYENGRRAIVTFEKGDQGDKALADALTAWGQN